MARMYEMNLVIRLQDRASARMRRISGDMSALSRHAQSQNRLMQLQAQAQRVQMKQGAALSTLRSMEVSDGEKRLANLAAQSGLTKQLLNQEIAMSTARTKRGTMGTMQVQRVIPKSVREDFIRLETDLERQQFLKRKGYNATEQAMMYDYHALRTRQLLLEGKITEEMAAQNRILAGTTAEEAALNAEIAQRSALTARGAAAEKNYVRGRTIAHGGSLAFMGGAVTTGLAGLAASSYAKFDVSSTKAATQVGAIGNSAAQTTKQAKELEKAILGMATEFPASADDMAQSAYDIFSSMSLGDTAVEQMTNGIKLLKVANKAAVGGQIDLGTATNTMITVLNDFNPSLKNIDHTMAQLFSTVRFMRGGFGDLGDAMNKLAPAAHASGQSLLEVGAAIAQVTRGIPSQAQAGTSVARLLDVFGRPDFQEGMRKFSAKFKQDLDITKVAADGTERLIPLHDIISKIVKLSPHLTGGGVDLQNTIKIITALGSASGKGGTQSTVQSRRALTELIIGYKNYSSILKQSREDTVEYDKSVKALSETAGVKWQIAMNKLKVAWIQFGQAAMPILLKVLDLLTRAFEHFSRMSSGHKKIIASLIVIAGLVATVGGLFASAFGGIFMLLAWNRLRLVLKATEALGVGAEVTATKIGLISKALLIMRRLAGPIAVVVSILYNISDKKKRHKIWDDAKHGMLGSAALELTVGTDFGIGDRFGGRKWKQPAKDREKWIKDALKDALSSKNTFGITNLNKVNKQAAAADKYGTDMLAWAKRMTAAEDASTKKIASYYKRLAKAKVEAAQAGKAAEEQSLKTMEAFMVSKESAFRSSNKQGMDLFGGPGAGGPIMGAFSDINNLLAGLNIKPIPVPVEFILQAQDFQVSQFEDWRSALDMLKKRLGPKYNKMVLELQSQGVASNPLVQSMLKATPAELKKWKTNWDKMQTDIEAATKADIKTLKDLWATYPKDVVTRIMLGLQDEEGTLSNGYRQYLVGTYPQQLAVEYGKAYNESLANWFASNPPPAPPKLPQMPKPKVGSASADRADMAKHPENYNDYPWVTDTPFGITEEMYKRMLKYLGYVTQINGSDFFGNPNLVRKNVVGPPAPVLKSPNMTPKGSQKGAPYRRAGGGIIPGTGSGDTVPAMLTPGEVVLNKRHIKNASQMLGTANHPQAVFNKVQHFAKGGVVAAKNYLGMKDVEFIKSSDGTISVMHVKGRDYLSRYRKYSPGQPGYDLLGTQGLHLTPEQLHPGKTKGLSLSGIGHGIAGLAGKAKRYGTGDLLHDVKSAAISSVKKQKHYGIGDTLRDVDAVIYGATGAHAKSIGKAYVPWVKQSAKQQAEIARVGEGAMFMGLPILGSGLASGMAQSGFMSYSMRASALSYHSATKVAARNAARRANAIHKGMPGSIGQNAFGITPHPHPVSKVVKTDAEEAARASHQANMLAWRREYNELQEKFGDYGTGLTEAEQAANKARRVELTAQMRSATAARPTAARAATSDIISPAQQKIINQREAEAATRLKETGQSTGVRLTKKQHLEKAARVLKERRTAWRIKNDEIVAANTEIRTVGLHDANTQLAALVEAAIKTSATLGNLGYTSNLNELILHGSEALQGFGLKPKTLRAGSVTRSYREFAALVKAAKQTPNTLRINPDAGFRPGSESVAIDVLQSFLHDPKQLKFLTKEEAAALAGRAGHGTVFIKDIQKLIGAKGTIAKAEKRMAASRAAFPAKRVSTKKGTQTAATIAKQAEAEKLVKSGEVSINKSTQNIGPIIEDSDFLKRIMDTATSLHLDGGGTEAEVAGLHEYVLKNYKKHYGSLASKISEALAGQSDVTLTPRGFNYLGSQDVFSAASWKRAERLREGDIDQLFSTLLDNNASDYGMFDVKFGKQSIYSQDRVDLPSMSVWAHDNKLHVDDVMDINDTEVFKTPLQKAMYVSALKSLRGEATEGRIKLYRGMSAKERASWGVGDTIPAGKYFTNIATSQYAQDIAGEFPELHSFLVDAVNIVETDPGSFQLLQDSTLSKLGIISAKSESINKSTRLPAHGLESEIGRVEAQKILDMLAANEPQVDIFRGLRNADFSNIDFDKLGVHWTTDRKIAELYAAPASVKNASGTVLSARTAIGNLIPPGPELEWWIRNAGVKTGMPTHHGSGMMQGRNIPWMDEFEATLRPGSKLNLTGSDLLTSGGKYSAVHDMDLTSAHQTLLGEGINKSTQSDKWKEAAPAVRSLWDRLDAAGGRKSRPKGSRGAEDAAAGFKRASSIWNVHPLLTNDPLTKSGLFAAFAHMDRIHRVPSDHNQLPMGLLQNTEQGNTAGIAKHITSLNRGSRPTGIDLAYPHMMRDFDLYSPNMYELALTAWHEMFHQYDYGFLKDQPKDKWPGSVFAAGAAGISSPYSFDRMRGKFNTSSAEDTLINPQLTEVFSQIYKTKLFDEQAQLGFLFHEPQVIGTYIKSGSDYRSIPYQVAPVELAARAYSQWMMTHPKSGVAMQRGFDKVHKAERDVGHWGRNQHTWDRDDFTGVAKSMEEFLGSKNLLRYAKGGWVPGTGNRDNYPAFLTPGEYVVSKPMIRDLTSRKASAAAPTTHVTHEQNINVDVTNPTGKAILDALKPVLFGLRHQP